MQLAELKSAFLNPLKSKSFLNYLSCPVFKVWLKYTAKCTYKALWGIKRYFNVIECWYVVYLNIFVMMMLRCIAFRMLTLNVMSNNTTGKITII